jgi:hypothetical protein
MAELHDPEDEPECDGAFDFDYEKRELTDANIRELTFQEIKQYHNPATKVCWFEHWSNLRIVLSSFCF